MIFADHIQGIDSRIQLQKIRLWNTSTGFVDSVAVAGVSESDKYGTLIYSTLTGENDLRYYGQTDGSTSRWYGLMTDYLPQEKIRWGDASNKVSNVSLTKPGVIPPDTGGIKLDMWARPGANIDMAGFTFNHLANPGSDQDAATKSYVDSQISSGGARVLPVARVATTANLAGVYTNGSGGRLTASANGTIPAASTDDVVLKLNDLVLVKNQGTGGTDAGTIDSANGLYTVQTVGSATVKWVLARHPEMDYGIGIPAPGAPANEFHNAQVPIKEGTQWGASSWHQNADNPTMGTTGIEFRLTKLGTTYKETGSIKIGDSNGLYFYKDTSKSAYTSGSLFRAASGSTIDELLRPNQSGRFVQVKGQPKWDSSDWSLPIALSPFSVIGVPGNLSSSPGAVNLTANIDTVLCRNGTGAVGFYSTIPSTAVDFTGLWPVTIDHGGTGKNLLNGTPSPTGTGTYSVLHTDTDNSRHGLLFRLEGGSGEMELTKGPKTDLDRILMHKGSGDGVSPVNEQGRKGWEWVSLWDSDNHFRGSAAAKDRLDPSPALKIGPSLTTATACQPVLLLENNTDGTVTTTASSPSIGWRAKWNSGGVQKVDWTAMVIMNDTAGSSSWSLGRCRDTLASATARQHLRVMEVNDTGEIRTLRAADDLHAWLTFSRVAADWSTTTPPGTRGESSVRFSTQSVNGINSDVLWKQVSPSGTGGNSSLELRGSGTTDLIWKGRPIGMAEGGFGVATNLFLENSLFYRGPTMVNGIAPPAGPVTDRPLIGATGKAPTWGNWSLPDTTRAFTSAETEGTLVVTGPTSVGVLNRAKTAAGVDANGAGSCRKFIKTITGADGLRPRIDHNLGTEDVVVSVRRTNGANATQQMYVTVKVGGPTQIQLYFANLDTSAIYSVTIIG